MTERVDIANMALSFLGEDEITSLEDESNRANQMKIQYIPSRDATLEAHEWSFAIERWVPGIVAAQPEWGGMNAFSVPTEILRVLTVDRDMSTEIGGSWQRPIGSQEQVDWVLEADLILCFEEVIYCRGIRRVEQEGRFSPLFVEALAAKLAYKTALNLTASAEIQANMFGMYNDFINDAKSRDGLQGRSRRLRNRSLIKSR